MDDQTLAVAAVAGGALGLLLPWVRVLFVQVQGIEVGDGQVYGASLVIVGYLAWRRFFRDDQRRPIAIALAVVSLLITAVVARDLGEVSSTDIATPGFSIYLSLAAGVALCAVAHHLLFGRKWRWRWASIGIAVMVILGALTAGASSAEDADFDSGFGDLAGDDDHEVVEARVGDEVEVEGAIVTVTGLRGAEGSDIFGETTSERVLLFEVLATWRVQIDD